MKRTERTLKPTEPMLLLAVASSHLAQPVVGYRMEKPDPKGGGTSMFIADKAQMVIDYCSLGWTCKALVEQLRAPTEFPSFSWKASVVQIGDYRRVSASLTLDGQAIIFQLRQAGEEPSALALPLEVYDAMVRCAEQARADAKSFNRPEKPIPPNLVSWKHKTPQG